MELLVCLLIISWLCFLAGPVFWRIFRSQDKNLREWESWQSAGTALEKLGREFQEGSGFIDTTAHPLDDWHLSFAHPGGDKTYYIEGMVLKRKINASQSLTDDRVLLNAVATPPEAPFSYPGGSIVRVRLIMNNQNRGQVLTAAFKMRKGL